MSNDSGYLFNGSFQRSSMIIKTSTSETPGIEIKTLIKTLKYAVNNTIGHVISGIGNIFNTSFINPVYNTINGTIGFKSAERVSRHKTIRMNLRENINEPSDEFETTNKMPVISNFLPIYHFYKDHPGLFTAYIIVWIIILIGIGVFILIHFRYYKKSGSTEATINSNSVHLNDSIDSDDHEEDQCQIHDMAP